MRVKTLFILCLTFLLVSCGPLDVHTIGCNVNDLITAINDSNATPATTDTIILQAGCTYELTAVDNNDFLGSNGLPVITSPIVVVGNGATIQRGEAPSTPQFRLFKVDATGDLELQNTTLANGEASPPSGAGVQAGGAIYSTGALSIIDSTLTNNQAEFLGGAIHNYTGVAEISNSVLSDNHSTHGGGVHNQGGDLTVTNTEFTDNRADLPGGTGMGGAIYNGEQFQNSTAMIAGSTFTGNQAFSGGAVANDQHGQMNIYDSSFTDNEATRGGAIANGNLLNIYRSIIADNRAHAGGGIENEWALQLRNSTISGNTITGAPSPDNQGAAINNLDGEFVVRFTTVTNNSGSGGRSAVHMANGVAGQISSSIIADNPSGDCGYSTSPPFNATGFNLDGDGSCIGFTITADPMLGPLANNGGPTMTHALLAGSPAINSADPYLCLSTDQRGEPRPQGASCDLGAYEYEESTTGPIGIATLNITPFVITPILPLDTPTPTISRIPPVGKILKEILCWVGPGDPYDVIGSIQPETQVELLGIGEGGGYLVILNPRYGIPCWVPKDDVDFGDFDLSNLPVISIPPLPTVPPTQMPVCTPPPCRDNESYYCPGSCPGGCGTTCATHTPPPVGSVSGIVWQDSNANGTKQQNESGYARVNVFLGTGACNNRAMGTLTTTTNANGNYSFSNVSPGTYCLFMNIVPTCESYSIATTPLEYTVVITSGGTLQYNFGFAPYIC